MGTGVNRMDNTLLCFHNVQLLIVDLAVFLLFPLAEFSYPFFSAWFCSGFHWYFSTGKRIHIQFDHHNACWTSRPNISVWAIQWQILMWFDISVAIGQHHNALAELQDQFAEICEGWDWPAGRPWVARLYIRGLVSPHPSFTTSPAMRSARLFVVITIASNQILALLWLSDDELPWSKPIPSFRFTYKGETNQTD